MSRFLRTLAKVGLVELDASEVPAVEGAEPAGLDDAKIARILAAEEEQHAAAAAEPSEPTAATGVSGETWEEGTSFDLLYQGADVPRATFSAEKLLKLLDGLKAMDPATRKAAVLAMDSADEAWTIEDVLLDAERKCRVLGSAIERADSMVSATEREVQGELGAVAQYVEKATATIRGQIADLERLLQTEVEKAAERRAELQTKVRDAREGAARERARYEQEMRRLREIAAIFGTPVGG